ncbi:MAG TPA: alpha-hydroxy-acid oxidizing protein [Gammaproteobacteria bacterium]|nr:alpha-hydroxy-acid oxidizing protein [Gammaproteobacteria bacterium]
MFFKKEIYSSADARRLAKKKLPWIVFDYYDGAAGEGYGECLNRIAIQQLRLQPRVLNNVEHRSLDVNVFEHRSKLPFGISPMGMCNLSRPGADLMLARMAAQNCSPLGVSTAASTSLEKLIEAADGNAWFQLYFSGNEQSSNALIRRAEQAGYKTLVLTVDVPEVGRRPRELRRGFKMPFHIGLSQFVDFALHPQWSLSTLSHGWPELANFGGEFGKFDRASSRAGADWTLLDRIRSAWKGHLVMKGVLSVEDALRMKEAGVDAIQVSSHGGRQLDSAPPAIHMLRHIRDAVGKDFPLFYDSGIRSGEDVVKAYAMGANFVFLGRPLLFAMAAGGLTGLEQIHNVFSTETSITLAQIGIRKMSAVTRETVLFSATSLCN